MKFIIRAYVKLTGYDKDVDGPCEDFNVCMWKVFDTPVHMAGVDTVWIRTPWDDLCLDTEHKSVNWNDSRPLVYAVDMDLKIILDNEQVIDKRTFINGMSNLGWCFDRWAEAWKSNWDEVLLSDQPASKLDDSKLSILIEDFEISARTKNALLSEGVDTIGDLVKLKIRDVKVFKNCGDKAVKELREKLNAMGLDFCG